MPEREARGVERRLGLGAAQPRPEPRGHRDRVDVDAAHRGEVERDEPVEPVAHRLDPADDARAAAEGHDRNALGRAGREHRLHVSASGGARTASGALSTRRSASG